MGEIRPRIIYEDEVLIIIDKPAGVVTNRAESVDKETLQDWMETVVRSQKSEVKDFESNNHEHNMIFTERVGMVHRLDKETSGVMIWAKNPKSMLFLMSQFKKRLVKKSYRALVHGYLNPKSGFVQLPIGRRTEDRRQFGIMPFGKLAYTDYQVEGHYKSIKINFDGYSLVDLWPKTGRTHQIRVHMKQIGHPLVSDPLYLSKKRMNADLEWCPRMFLHAQSIGFVHPITKKELEFNSDLPDDLVSSMSKLVDS